MSEESPPRRPQTFSEKLSERPRARIFTIFTILGLAVTPTAVVVLLVHPSTTGAQGRSGIRFESVIAAALIGAHLLCAFLARRYWKNEVPKPRTKDDDE